SSEKSGTYEQETVFPSLVPVFAHGNVPRSRDVRPQLRRIEFVDPVLAVHDVVYDQFAPEGGEIVVELLDVLVDFLLGVGSAGFEPLDDVLDRKSTRLNSSHVKISYAVFCLNKTKWY